MITRPSLAAAPVERWAHFSYMRRILRANEDATGCLHPGGMLPPSLVALEDDQDVVVFGYAEVTYRFDRDLEVLFELRPGMCAAYTRSGALAYVTRTSAGIEPLLRAINAEAPKHSGWN